MAALGIINPGSSAANDLSERHGNLVIVSPSYPNAVSLARIDHDPSEHFQVARGIAAVQRMDARFATPSRLDGDLEAVESIGATGDRGWSEVSIRYSDGLSTVVLFQMFVGGRDVYVLDGGPNAVEDRTSLRLKDGTDVWARVPRAQTPQDNPRQLRWVANGVQTTLTAFGFQDLASVRAIAETLRSEQAGGGTR